MNPALQSCPKKRTKHVLIETPEMIEEARTNYRVLPSFERNLSEQSLKRHYSMVSNDYLRSHWWRCLDKFHRTGAKRSEPLHIPYHGDFHFHNGEVKYRPNELMLKNNSFKYNFKPGPGSDHIGELPIPNEMKYKRTGTKLKVDKGELSTPKRSASDDTLKNLEKQDRRVRLSRVIPPRKVEKKTDIHRITNVNNTAAGVVPFGRPISGKRAIKNGQKFDKRTTVTKTTIKVTEKATVNVNRAEHKIVVQNTCTVAVHNRKKSTLI